MYRPRTAPGPGPTRSAPFPSTSGSGAAVRGSARGGPGPESGGSGSAVAKMSRGSIEIPLRDTDEASRARGGRAIRAGARAVAAAARGCAPGSGRGCRSQPPWRGRRCVSGHGRAGLCCVRVSWCSSSSTKTQPGQRSHSVKFFHRGAKNLI